MVEVKQIQQSVRAAGIVGAGGAGFPTHVKMNAQAEIYLVNGAECEPLLKVDQQLAAKDAPFLIRGLQLGMIATGAKEGVIALKAKYESAIDALTPLLHDNMRIHILQDVYPSGDEVITIWMATGRRVPPAALPLDVGVVVNNVQTLINVAKAVDSGTSVTHKTLTVTGAVQHPLTITVPVGISFREAIALAGGETISNPAYIDGGPMMGRLITDLDEAITKATGGIIVLPDDHIIIKRQRETLPVSLKIAKATCEQCRLCTDLCPRHLIGHELPPHAIVYAIGNDDTQHPSVLLSALTCSECAICEAWSCPEDISPMKLNQALKAKFRPEGARYVGPLNDADPMIEGRLVPIKRLILRLDIAKYNVKAPLLDVQYNPSFVRIKLSQHIGAPAKPVVKAGEAVCLGQLIGDIPENALGATVHASINGVVEAVSDSEICIRAQ